MARRYWPLGRARRRPRRRGVIALLAVAAVLAVGGVAGGVAAAAGGAPPIGVRNLRIGVTDGPDSNQHVVLDATFFTPAGDDRVPAILLAHGFGETKDAVRPEAEQLARAGFAVLTWSARGMGASTGQIALDSPDYEVKDVEQLVTWLARQPRVRLDGPGDPRVGIAGASYGGAIALLAAAYDHRIDAVVPEETWNNLATALFPNAAGGGPAGGVLKREWAGLLFTQGVAAFGASLSPAARARLQAEAASGGAGAAKAAQEVQCGRFLPQVCVAYQQAAALGRPTPQVISLLQASSPASVARRIDVPALIIQGENDSLFGLDQANANYAAVRRNGAPADMVWFAGGHDGGDQEATRLAGLTQAWFERWLMPRGRPWRPGDRIPGPGEPTFAVTRDEGIDASTGQDILRIATAPRYPGLGGTRQTLVRLAGPAQPVVNPAGGAPPSVSVFPALGSLGLGGESGVTGGGLAFDVPGQTAAFQSAPLRAPLQVTGSMTVRIRVAGTGPVTLFAKVYDVDQAGSTTLPFSLAAPLRVTGAARGRVVTVTLPAMDYQFAAGHRLRLALTTTDFAYATSPAPATDLVALAGRGLTVPSDPALAVSGASVPWWTWATPVAALVAAGLILAAGRRRPRSGGYRPDLAGVPLEITGLTKRYRDGQLAVDDVSLRVEHGQIMGLLGPNGAGKTTTLRALMGLLHPDAGTITIFGRQVHAGSAALSRLGAFVEGPGFLPHLSGRANLEMYWRAAGRRAADAHAEEVMAIAGLGTAIDRPVRTYSRGMCQRLAIAQAMLGLPDLLVLDEPMNGLDPPQIREMRDVLLGYAAQGRTVILSSHMLAEVELTCSHVAVMHLGRCVAAGRVAEITGAGAGLIIGTPEGGRAVSVLTRLDGIEGAEQHPDGVLVHTDGVPASDVVAALVGAGVPVERVTPNRRLEDAFLTLIGEAGPAEVGGALP